MAERRNRQRSGKRGRSKPPPKRKPSRKPAPKASPRAGRGGKRSTSWAPGTSGNPKGRPPLPEDYKLAIGDMGPRGLKALDAILDDPWHPRHAEIAMYVVNRWKGTPTARTELSGPGGGPVPMKTVLTSDEKRRRVVELAAIAAARVEAAKKKNGGGSSAPPAPPP